MAKVCCFCSVFRLIRVEILSRQFLIIACRIADGRKSYCYWVYLTRRV